MDSVTARKRAKAEGPSQSGAMRVYQLVREWREGEAYADRVLSVRAWLEGAGIANVVCVADPASGHAPPGACPLRRVPRSPSRGDVLVMHRDCLPREAARHLARRFPALVFLGPVAHREEGEGALDDGGGGPQPDDVLGGAKGELLVVVHSGAAKAALAGSGLGIHETEVIPVVSAWEGVPRAGGDARLARMLDDGRTNILFCCRRVTRAVMEDLLDVFHAYHRLVNASSRLIIWGGITPADLEFTGREVQRRGLQDSVLLLPSSRSAEKVSCLEKSHIFLAPGGGEEVFPDVVSAMHASLPVVARADGYLEELLGDCGVLYEDEDPVLVGELLESLCRDPLLRERVLQGQRDRYRLLCEAEMRDRLLKALRRLGLDQD